MTTTLPEVTTPPQQLTLAQRIGAGPPDTSVKFLNELLYAEPSIGKTFHFGTATEWPEEFLPSLLIDLDGGWETVRFKGKNPNFHISPPIRDLDTLKELYRELAADFSSGNPFYKTLFLDNISELQKMDMNEVMLEAKATANNPDKVDIYIPSQREWGKSGERMRIIIRAFRDLPCHTICAAYTDERENKQTQINQIWPGMPGKLRHEISGFFSVIGYMSVYMEGGETFRQIQFKKTQVVQARCRFVDENDVPVLPDLMKNNPTLPDVWRIIKESGAHLLVDDPLTALSAAVTP